MLLKLINALQLATGITLEPFGATSTSGNHIVYNSYPISDDGAVCQSRLELRLITHSAEQAELLKQKVISAIVTVGDNTEIDGINEVRLNGGGQLKDWETNAVHTLLYFYVITGSEK